MVNVCQNEFTFKKNLLLFLCLKRIRYSRFMKCLLCALLPNSIIFSLHLFTKTFSNTAKTTIASERLLTVCHNCARYHILVSISNLKSLFSQFVRRMHFSPLCLSFLKLHSVEQTTGKDTSAKLPDGKVISIMQIFHSVSEHFQCSLIFDWEINEN